MSELRWNPVLEEWVITSTSRQKRPQLPDDCPLCPGVLEIPHDYEIVAFENKYPSLHRKPPEPDEKDDDLYKVRKAQGICEVVV